MEENCKHQKPKYNTIQIPDIIDNELEYIYASEYDPTPISEEMVINAFTLDKLEKATCVTYSFHRGSIPMGQWSCHIYVKRNVVHVTVNSLCNEEISWNFCLII